MSDTKPVFRVLLRAQIAPGKEEAFEEAWRGVGNAVTGDPANLGQWLLRSNDEESVYYIISDWVDEPSFRVFERSDQHLEHRQRLHPYRTGGSMTTMTMAVDLAKPLAVAE
ncbi:antibiotic biosynthesis monooxygenase [Micromonospora sp. CPCC 205371]|nr:antibiotic biosynthesis monooxygenase [Micromonospora sp. CPCC 205371]